MALDGIPRGRELGPPPAAARGRQAWLPLPRSLRRPQPPRSNDFALTAPPRTEEARPRSGPPAPSVGAHPRAPPQQVGYSQVSPLGCGAQQPARSPACGRGGQRRPAPHTRSPPRRRQPERRPHVPVPGPGPRPRLPHARRSGGSLRSATATATATTGDGHRSSPRGSLTARTEPRPPPASLPASPRRRPRPRPVTCEDSNADLVVVVRQDHPLRRHVSRRSHRTDGERWGRKGGGEKAREAGPGGGANPGRGGAGRGERHSGGAGQPADGQPGAGQLRGAGRPRLPHPHGPASAPTESPVLPVCLHPRPGTASPSTAAEYPWAPLNTPRYRCTPTRFFFTFFAWNSSFPQVTALLCKGWCQRRGAGTKPCPKARAGQDCLAQPRCGLRLAKPVVKRHGQ